MKNVCLPLVLLLLAACGPSNTNDGGTPDSGEPTDSGMTPTDGGTTDGGDAGPTDAGSCGDDAGPPGTFTKCYDCLGCVQNCTDMCCTQACLAASTSTVQSLAAPLETCLQNACPTGGMTCLGMAAQNACNSQFESCFNNK